MISRSTTLASTSAPLTRMRPQWSISCQRCTYADMALDPRGCLLGDRYVLEPPFGSALPQLRPLAQRFLRAFHAVRIVRTALTGCVLDRILCGLPAHRREK